MRIAVLAAIALTTVPGWAQQHNCDCTEIVGACEASITAEPTGSAGSYVAKLRFRSTAPLCSKISYYVDSTPYFTILSRGNTDEDSIFGTKPITRETLSEVKCQVCKQVSAVHPPGETKKESVPVSTSPFAGTWVGVERIVFGRTRVVTLTLDVEGEIVRGTWSSDLDTNRLSGTINGSEIKGSIAPGPKTSGNASVTFKLIDPDTLHHSFLFGSTTFKKQK